MQFTTQEHEQGLAYLSGHVKPDEIQNANLLRVLKNRGTQQLFIGEASQDHEISVKQITQVKQALERHNQKRIITVTKAWQIIEQLIIGKLSHGTI